MRVCDESLVVRGLPCGGRCRAAALWILPREPGDPGPSFSRSSSYRTDSRRETSPQLQRLFRELSVAAAAAAVTSAPNNAGRLAVFSTLTDT